MVILINIILGMSYYLYNVKCNNTDEVIIKIKADTIKVVSDSKDSDIDHQPTINKKS